MTFWTPYPKLADQLNTVQDTMSRTIKIKNEQTQQAILSLITSGGKMLRPAYLLLFSEFSSLDQDKRIALASSIELLHTATLIHDDVIDQAQTRRGVPTISHLYGTDVAVYAGDYLFICVFKLMVNHALDMSHLSNRITAMETVLNGELAQMTVRYDPTQTIKDYITTISGKTGELFAQACAVPLIADKQPLLAKLAYDIGLHIGIAFQVMDDYLDYTSDNESFGKPVLADIKQGIYTAPVLFAIGVDKRVAPLLEAKAYTQVLTIIAESDALDKTFKLAQKHTNIALKLINKLPDKPVKSDIFHITKTLLERQL